MAPRAAPAGDSSAVKVAWPRWYSFILLALLGVALVAYLRRGGSQEGALVATTLITPVIQPTTPELTPPTSRPAPSPEFDACIAERVAEYNKPKGPKIEGQLNSGIGDTRWLVALNTSWLGDAPVVFDVGANKGAYSEGVLDACPRCIVHAFELMPKTYDLLKEVHAARPADHGRWFLHNAGMSNVTGQIFVSGDPGSPLSGLGQNVRPDNAVNSQRTVINTVPNAMRELGLESLDLLKVDVEGFEWEVFMGVDLPLNKHRIRMFTFEYGGTWVDKRASAPRSFYLLVRIADSAGYDCFIIASDDLYQVNGQFEFDHVVHPTHGNSGNILCVRRDEPMWCHVLSRVRQSMSHCVNEAPVCKAIAEKRGQRWPGPH